MELIVYPFLVSIVLFYFYETDFFVEYAKLFGLGKAFKLDEYKNHQLEYPENSYWEWFVWSKPTFLRKLISCPFCLGFWLNVAVYYFYRDLGLLVINLWVSIFLFLLLIFMYKRSYNNE